MQQKVVVPDTSAIINAVVSSLVESGELKGAKIIIHNATMTELEVQANKKKDTGFVGLDEMKRLQQMAKDGKITIEFAGRRPSPEEIRWGKFGMVDSLIRELARERNALFITSDKVQADVAAAYGLEVMYVAPIAVHGEPEFVKYFDGKTMSVHLRANVPPMAKKGLPGRFKLVNISDKPLSEEDVKRIAKEIVERASREPNAYIEREYEGATVVQYKNYRIVIAHPPFSDAWEITIVKPLVKTTLDDYSISDKLLRRLEEKAEGILIAGPPGSGKSTFAQALAEFYASKGKIVKTMESPRDLQVDDTISQYAPLEGDMEGTGDILLLLRPDYTVFDEVRKTRDFEIFADMRMAGVGMIGVVHASTPIEAIQRFVRRLELGIIPQVVDTVIFIEGGDVEKVYSLDLTVKVPTGMTDEDLARPVVEVRDFETGELEFEIYTYGEETFVVPVREGEKKTPVEQHAEKAIRLELERLLDVPFKIELKGNKVILYAYPEDIPHIIGRKGTNISSLENAVGMSIDVRPMEEEKGSGRVSVKETPKYFIIQAGKNAKNRFVKILVDGEEVGYAKANKKGVVKVKKNTELGEIIKFARRAGKRIEVEVQ
ncbi:MAG: ATPase [Candidatus Diapherotrites archaeon]|nr:ATPase [Candidatus Diapherotrites archaeon]MDN5367075.1 ATPase [Candidatus Diapherotrites archaeon]